jgi:hypothetical protein
VRCGNINSSDVCVGDLRAQHIGLRHFLELDIVGLAALSGNKGLVLETPNGLAHAKFHDCTRRFRHWWTSVVIFRDHPL